MRCRWCGKFFIPEHNATVYCSTECRRHSRQEQNRIHSNNYYHKYKKLISNKKTYGLGSGYLGPSPATDFSIEKRRINNERRRLRLPLMRS